MDPDDIDELLDEVESKFLKAKSSAKSARNLSGSSDSLEELDFPHIACSASSGIRNAKSPLPASSPKEKKQDSIEKAIDDICNLSSDPMVQAGSQRKKSDGGLQRRCLPVYLGGSSVATGLSSNVTQRACSNLLCTACDFHVCMFDDYVWDKTTDYLFLRNHIPDFDRLRKKLHHKKGWRAYACQCEHRSVGALAEVKTFDLKWVCAKH